jgi:hypothetical protein
MSGAFVRVSSEETRHGQEGGDLKLLSETFALGFLERESVRCEICFSFEVPFEEQGRSPSAKQAHTLSYNFSVCQDFFSNVFRFFFKPI